MTYVLIAYAFSWAVWTLPQLSRQSPSAFAAVRYQHFLGAYGPLVGAFLTTLIFQGVRGVRRFASQAFNVAVGWQWYAFAIGSPLAFLTIGLVPILLFGAPAALRDLGLTSQLPGFSPLSVWLVWTLTFGLGEETGWRGFLLPVLSSRFPTFSASLIVAAVWAVWHTPMFFYHEPYIQMGIGIVGWAVGLVFGSVFLGWLARNVRFSVIPVMLWHGAYNWIVASDVMEGAPAAIVSAFVIIAAIIVRRRYGEDLAIHPQRPS